MQIVVVVVLPDPRAARDWGNVPFPSDQGVNILPLFQYMMFAVLCGSRGWTTNTRCSEE